jgi:YD repeat-containing protein
VTPSPLYVTEYQYDNADNLSRVTRAKGDTANERAVDYVYDGLSRVKKETQYPSWPTTTPTLVTQFGYDQNSNRASLLDPLGQTTTLGYDALDRLTSIVYSDGVTPNVSYGYDANDNRTSMADGTGSTSYAHDELDQLLSVTSPGPKTVAYRYDRDGNRTKVIYSDGTAVSYAFDKAGRLESLLDWASRATSYQYWPDGSLKQIASFNTTTATYTYDKRFV